VESDEFKYKFNSGVLSLNVKDIHGEYPLITAFSTNNMSIFKYLLEHGANCNIKNSNGSSLLSLAVHKGKYDAIKLMLNQQQFINNINANSSTSTSTSSTTTTSTTTSTTTINNNYNNNTEININEMDASGNCPLIKAITQNALDIVMLLAEYGINHNIDMNGINGNGDTPLTLAYRLKYRTVFRYLLCYLDINQKDRQGNNVLYYAIDSEDIETIQYLIRNKVDVNSKNIYGVSCLDFAISKGSKIFNIFLKNNYDNIQFNIPNGKGEIPLITIIRAKTYSVEEKEEIVNCLLEKGSNVNFVDEQGNSSLFYALKKKLSPIVKLLIRNGANINNLSTSKHKTILKYASCLDGDITKYLMGQSDISCENYSSDPSNLRNNIDMDISESHTNNTNNGKDKYMMEYLEYLMF
jgi:ankyrin repeat protein